MRRGGVFCVCVSGCAGGACLFVLGFSLQALILRRQGVGKG